MIFPDLAALLVKPCVTVSLLKQDSGIHVGGYWEKHHEYNVSLLILSRMITDVTNH